jgi:hypothetical protein
MQRDSGSVFSAIIFNMYMSNDADDLGLTLTNCEEALEEDLDTLHHLV